MQFSTLSLHALIAVYDATDGKVGKYKSWKTVKGQILKQGFTEKQAEGELDRFCYGFECQDRFQDCERQISLTHIGKMFVDSLLNVAAYQDNMIAVLFRSSRRKKYWNVIIQESTFWPGQMYALLSKYGFRNGPARDHLKCLSVDDIIKFLDQAMSIIKPQPKRNIRLTLQDCLNLVERHGKCWASVGGKYSWFVFPQHFELQFDDLKWEKYKHLVKELIRPPEWGGGKTISDKEIMKLLNKSELDVFLNNGIIRAIYNSDGQLLYYQLTAVGYLVWERYNRDTMIEISISKLSETTFDLRLCSATDLPNHLSSLFSHSGTIPSWALGGPKKNLLKTVKVLLTEDSEQKVLFA